MRDGDGVPELEELYDHRTLAALESGTGEPNRREWRPRGARPGFGALMTGAALGLQEILDPRSDRDAVVEFRPGDGEPEGRWVTFLYVPGAPHASRIVVRPWLAPARS